MGWAKVADDEEDGMSIGSNEVTIFRHCQDSFAHVFHGENRSLQCLVGTSIDGESGGARDLDINTNVSSKNTGLQGKSNANAIHPNRVSIETVRAAAGNGTRMNSFLPSPVDQPYHIHASSAHSSKIQIKAKRIKCLLTNENIIVGGTSNSIL